jgi:hypothetical protein
MKPKKIKQLYKVVESLVNKDQYYTADSFPTKTIDGKIYITVKKNPGDRQTFWMLKENMKYV